MHSPLNSLSGRASPRYLDVGLTVGVVAVSFAAIFIRLADAPPLVIAAYRMSIGAGVMVVLAAAAMWRRKSGLGLSRKDLPLLGFSSLCLAVHFWSWIASLEYTSVASSVVLVTTNPFIVAVASRVLWGEPIYKRTLAGIAIGVAGGVVIALGDASGHGKLQGDLLAFMGALSAAAYMLAGRRLRTRANMPTLTYTSVVYTGAALLLVAVAIAAEQPFTGYTPGTYAMLLLVALVPQVIGHSLLNWSLAHVTATVVTISVMAEPIIATAAAVPILRELPPVTSVAGGALVLAGIYVSLGRRKAA